MIEHIVLIKVKGGIPHEKLDRMVQELKALKQSIPGISELSCGENTSKRSQGFTHGLHVLFPSRADLDAYIIHPNHQQVVQHVIRPIIDDIIVVDYES